MPEIFDFSADLGRIHKGATTLLRWDTSDLAANVRIDPSIGNVSSVGFALVSPTTTTTYTLTARNNFGTAQRRLTLVVFTEE